MKIRYIAVAVIAFLICLTGYHCEAQTQHGINVQWVQGTCTSCTVDSNSVYQSPTSTGTFVKIFTSTTAITSYLDPLTSTNQGTLSCYKVTAISKGIESAQSPTAVCATFPVQPSSPSGVSATAQ